MKDLANRKAVTSLVRSKNRNLRTKNSCRGNQDQDLSVLLSPGRTTLACFSLASPFTSIVRPRLRAVILVVTSLATIGTIIRANAPAGMISLACMDRLRGLTTKRDWARRRRRIRGDSELRCRDLVSKTT